jgi:hypothetical protein
MRACGIMAIHPAYGDQGFADAVPVAYAGDELDGAGGSPLPGHRELGTVGRVSHPFWGEGSFSPFTRGRPMVRRVRGGGGSYHAASPENLLTTVT